MRTLRFDIEAKTIGKTRAWVAAAISSAVGGALQHVGTPYCYDPYASSPRTAQAGGSNRARLLNAG